MQSLKIYQSLSILFWLICFSYPISVGAQDWFEAGSKPKDYAMGGDPTQPHGTDSPGFIRSEKEQIDGFGTWMTQISPDPYRGQAVHISAMVRSHDVVNWAGLWARVDGADGTLTFDNMSRRPISGTTDWMEYYVILDVPGESTGLFFGILLNGTGEVLIDGVQLKPAVRTWVRQYSNENFFFSIEAVDDQIVWAGGSSGSYLRTTDGGQNWTSGTISEAEDLTLLSVKAFDENTAYFIAQQFPEWGARIYGTRDGGETWNLQYENNDQGAFFIAIDFWDENNGIAIGDPVDGSFVILTTSDAGETWTPVPPEQIPLPLPGEFAGFGDTGGKGLTTLGSQLAWFGTAYGSGTNQPVRILKTGDGGKTWTATETPYSPLDTVRGIASIAFRDSLHGFAGGSQGENIEGGLLKTLDGGVNWEVVESFPSLQPATISYIPVTNGQSVFVTSLQGSAYSSDGGVSWDTLSTEPHLAADFASSSAGWALNIFQGGIDKFEGFMTTSQVELPIATLRKPLSIRNHPNPFEESTTVFFSLPMYENVQMDLWELNGQWVGQILNQNLPAGEHEFEAKFKDLKPGIYLIRIQTPSLTGAQKIICLK